MKIGDLPLGSKIYGFGEYNGEKLGWIIVSKNHPGHPSNSVTLMTDKDIVPGRVIGPYSYADMGKYDDYILDWKYSADKQWMNSDKKSDWWSAQFSGDSKGQGLGVYESMPGFLADWKEEHKAMLMDVTVQYLIWKDQSTGSTTCKVFPPSAKELGYVYKNSKGTAFGAARNLFIAPSGTVVSSGYTNSYITREVYPSDLGGTDRYSRIMASSPWEAGTNPEYITYFKYANTAYMRPVCCISADNEVWDTPIAGFYAFGGKPELEFTLNPPMSVSTMPTLATLSVSHNTPSGVELSVEICNNGDDAEPTWQTVEPEQLGGTLIPFENKTKTAETWAVDVRVKQKRVSSWNPCWVSGVSGTFQ